MSIPALDAFLHFHDTFSEGCNVRISGFLDALAATVWQVKCTSLSQDTSDFKTKDGHG